MKVPQHQIRAAVTEGSLNEENRSVDITWTTGSKGLRRSWAGDYYEELSLDPAHVDMSRINDSAPLLAAHDDSNLDSVVGVVERAWLEGDKGGATVRFASDEISQRVYTKVKEKILRNISVGYQVSQYEDVSQAGDTVPTLRATRWQPMELSIVPIGFDAGAKVRKQENINENEVEILSRTENSTEASVDAEESMTVKKTDLESAPAVDAEAIKKEAAAQERQRATEIRQAVRSAKLEDTLADQLIDRGVTADEARKEVLAEMAKKPAPAAAIDGTVRVEVGVSDTEKKREAAVESLLVRLDSTNFQPTQGNPFRGMSMLRMMEEFQGGRQGRTDAIIASRAMSSSDLPYILANVAEKAALKRYQIQPRTWNRWAKADVLRNYKTKDLLRSGDFSSLEERQEAGEFKRGSFGESREQVQLKDWGKIMSFTRRMLINDDLGEIAKVSSEAGVAAARLENRLVYEILTGNPNMADGTALFHADHENLLSAAALTDSTIGEAFRKMREQTTIDGLDKLNLAPKYLICGPSEEVTARKYLAQISPTQASNVNVFSSSLELIVDAEISTNDYFFAADQNLIDTVTLFRLEGEESPRVESRVDFETESVEIKCAHAAVAKAVDHRGMCKSANAS
jgi:hypothetical protein